MDRLCLRGPPGAPARRITELHRITGHVSRSAFERRTDGQGRSSGLVLDGVPAPHGAIWPNRALPTRPTRPTSAVLNRRMPHCRCTRTVVSSASAKPRPPRNPQATPTPRSTLSLASARRARAREADPVLAVSRNPAKPPVAARETHCSTLCVTNMALVGDPPPRRSVGHRACAHHLFSGLGVVGSPPLQQRVESPATRWCCDPC